MQTKVVSSLDDVGLDERGWNDLVHQSDTDTVFQTHQWTRSWLKAFGGDYRPLFVTLEGRDGVRAVAPMVIGAAGAEPHVIRFLGDGRADYCDFLAGREGSEGISSLLDAILSSAPRALELNNVPARSRTSRLVREVCSARGYHVLVDRQYLCPRLIIDGNLEAARRIRDKASLRRRDRLLRRRGHVAIRHLRTHADVEPLLERFFAQHVARWTGSASPSLFVNEQNRVFYRLLTSALEAEGWLLFTVVQLEEQPIAFHYGFDYQRAVLWYKPSFDVAHASCSPGLLLVRALIDYAIDNGRAELDFTVGDEPFKARFTNSQQATVRIRVYRSAAAVVRARFRRRVSALAKRIRGISRITTGRVQGGAARSRR